MDSVLKNLIVYHLSRQIDIGTSFGIEPADYVDWVKLFLMKFIIEHTARFADFATIHTTMLLVLGTEDEYVEKDTPFVEIDPFYLPYDDLDVDYTSLHVFGDESQSCSDRDELSDFVSNISHVPEGVSWGSESDTSFVEHLEEIQEIPTKAVSLMNRSKKFRLTMMVKSLTMFGLMPSLLELRKYPVMPIFALVVSFHTPLEVPRCRNGRRR